MGILIPMSIGLSGFNPGTWGDMFGGVNALFSGLAFAGIIVTLFFQREDLRMQRNEMEESRKVLGLQQEELKRQADEVAAQAAIMRAERAEKSFFDLLRILKEIVDSANKEHNQGKMFAFYLNRFHENLDRPRREDEQSVITAYESNYKRLVNVYNAGPKEIASSPLEMLSLLLEYLERNSDLASERDRYLRTLLAYLDTYFLVFCSIYFDMMARCGQSPPALWSLIVRDDMLDFIGDSQFNQALGKAFHKYQVECAQKKFDSPV